MRVCMLAYTFYECDNRVMRYADALTSEGNEVDVIALRQPGQDADAMIHGVRVFRIQARVKNERSQFAYMFRILIFILHSMFFLGLKHVRRPYQLIHVHSMPDFLVFAAWLPRLMGAKLVLDIHDLSPELYSNKFSGKFGSLTCRALRAAERASARFAHHVIVPNHLWLEKLIARSVRADRCSVFMNLPDSSIFAREECRPERPGKVRVLYPGSLQWHQGLDLAIRGMGHLRASGQEVELHIYGDGQAKPSLMELTHELGVQDAVFFHQSVPLREVAQIMGTADVGIIPKRSDSFGDEAFSTKILEFMALGIPVLVAATKVDRFYFNEEVVTFFTPGSWRELADRLRELIENPERRARQADLAEQLVRYAFCWEMKKQEYLGLIEDLVFASPRIRPRLAPVNPYEEISRR